MHISIGFSMSFYFLANRHVSKNDPHEIVFKSHGNRVSTQ